MATLMGKHDRSLHVKPLAAFFDKVTMADR